MIIGIIGAGPSGIMSAIEILNNSTHKVLLFDKTDPLLTLLPTGGGRCNLTYAEFDNTELIKFYPRGEKFLLSVFSRFSTGDTINFFEKLGVETYIQNDMRVFPKTNSAKNVREKLLEQLKNKNIKFIKEEITSFQKKEKTFELTTSKKTFQVDKIIFAGGIKNNQEILNNAGIKLIPPKPALCALSIKEKELYSLSGVAFKNITATTNKNKIYGDLLIAHNYITGPLAYKISSIYAFAQTPYQIKLNFVNEDFHNFDSKLITLLNENSKKNFTNIISSFVPHSFANYIVKNNEIKASQVNKELRQQTANMLTEFPITVLDLKKDGEVVTAGGVNLDYVNSKTMESKQIEGLYFCGEVLNIDGFTGGFNLQNCWSTGYLAGKALQQLC